MKYRQLGRTKITVSEIAMGCWGLVGGSMWGPQDESESIATIKTALDSGVNFFDTAEAYGDGYSEEMLGKALLRRRKEAVIATKIRPSDLSAEAVLSACERSLKRLKTDYIDLYQIHWPSRVTPIEETMGALVKLQEAGKVRAIGVSNYGVSDLSELLVHSRVASNQLPYSLLWRAIEYEIQSLCIQADIGILCYSPLLHGILSGKYASPDDVPPGKARTRHFSKDRPQARHDEEGCEHEVFAALDRIQQIASQVGHPMPAVGLAWLLYQPGVSSVIVGARKPEQITQMSRASDLSLTPATLLELSFLTEPLKQALGSNPDMWQSKSRFR